MGETPPGRDRPRPREDDRIDTVYADAAVCYDAGETVRILLFTDEPDPEGGPVRRRRQWVVLPRSGFLVSLFEAMDQFAGPPGGAGPRPH